MQVQKDSEVSSPYLMMMMMAVVSIAILGLIAIANGFMPFSPSFFISYPLSAASCYLLILSMCYRFEMSDSPHSVRPYLSEDPQLFFNAYLLSSLVWALGLVPVFWLRMGQFALQGASVDEMVFQNRYVFLAVCLVGIFIYFLRQKAVEQKDLYRVNRQSPAVSQSALDLSIAPGWSHSDVWDTITCNPTDLKRHSERDREHYQKRRAEKLRKDTHEVEIFRTTDLSEYLTDAHPDISKNKSLVQEINTDDSQTSYSNAESFASTVLPSWIEQGAAAKNANSHSKYDYPQSTMRRSVNDFDTRFEQAVIPTYEVLADNVSWSGISRPAQKPFIYDNHQEVHLRDIKSHDEDQLTAPPHASPHMNHEQAQQAETSSQSFSFNEVNIKEIKTLGGDESLENQLLFEQVLEVISDTQVQIDQYDSQAKIEVVERISFNSLNGLNEFNEVNEELKSETQTQIGFGAIDSSKI